MLYLYLDESGDLNFDFLVKRPSKYFTICILAVHGVDNERALVRGVKKALRKAQDRRSKKKKDSKFHEFKGSSISLNEKMKFYDQIKEIPFEIYAMTLNKRRVYDDLAKNRHRVYNFITRQVVNQISFHRTNSQIQLIVDKSKGKQEIKNFNSYIAENIKANIDPKISLDIRHVNSLDEKGIQAVDIFANGVFRKYERGDLSWYDAFSEKIAFDEIYLQS